MKTEIRPPLPPLQVYLDPYQVKGAMPFVRFFPGMGWVILGNSAPLHSPSLAEAVSQFNRVIVETCHKMNAESVNLSRVPVQELPGWGDAVRDEMESQPIFTNYKEKALDTLRANAYQEAPEGYQGFPTAPETFGASPATLPVYAQRSLHEETLGELAKGGKQAATREGCKCAYCAPLEAPGPLRPMTPLEEILEGFLEAIEAIGDSKAEAIPEPHPAIVAMLANVGWLKASGKGFGHVRVPKRLGEEYRDRLKAAIIANDLGEVARCLAECPAP